ncbi:MAG: YafY family transcriptional regulator [Zoogloea sp.]|nr:YafY family transcriptional regulator [Zoogloea sp.]
MSRAERFYLIEQILSSQGVASSRTLRARLEISPATLKRDIAFLRDRMRLPIVWDGDAGGYRIDRTTAGDRHELPGLWFSDREIHALLTMRHLLEELAPGGILSPHVQPLMTRLDALLGAADNTSEEIRRRVLVVGLGRRVLELQHFERVGSALLQRKRLRIAYFGRSRGELSRREISPQRLVHYRENWYLDAWCHLRGAIRNFALDAIQSAEVLDAAADDLDPATLDAILGPGYGIFAGQHIQWARLRFTPQRARWVASERWHPEQRGHFEADGCYLLEIPYADDRELLMDILRYGTDCEVLAPEGLRGRVVEQVTGMAEKYGVGVGVGSAGEPGAA